MSESHDGIGIGADGPPKRKVGADRGEPDHPIQAQEIFDNNVLRRLADIEQGIDRAGALWLDLNAAVEQCQGQIPELDRSLAEQRQWLATGIQNLDMRLTQLQQTIVVCNLRVAALDRAIQAKAHTATPEVLVQIARQFCDFLVEPFVDRPAPAEKLNGATPPAAESLN